MLVSIDQQFLVCMASPLEMANASRQALHIGMQSSSVSPFDVTDDAQHGIVLNLSVGAVSGNVVTDVAGAIGPIATAPPGPARGTAADLRARNAQMRSPSLKGTARRREQEDLAQASAPPPTTTNTQPEQHQIN